MLLIIATFDNIYNIEMKKVLGFIVLGLIIIACNSVPENGFSLTGELTGEVADSTEVYLRTTDSLRQFIEVDTVLVQNGSFEFSGLIEKPTLHYVYVENVRGNVPVVLENGKIEIKAQKDSLAFAKLSGSPQNEMFMQYLLEIRRMSAIGRTFNEDLQKARAAQDEATIQSLREEYFELQEKGKQFEVDFINDNPNSLIGAIILERMAAQKGLPVLEIEELVKKLTPEIQDTEPVKRLTKMIAEMKATAIGSTAPDFSGPNPNGAILALNDIKGKLTLIDFWAGWCKPCRNENPNIVAVYEKYKDKGLEVVGVSLDRNREQWLQAIEDDNLSWNHVSNVQYFQDPIAKLYSVNAIPAAFLIDENGVIVAKNLRGPALEAKVAEYLN